MTENAEDNEKTEVYFLAGVLSVAWITAGASGVLSYITYKHGFLYNPLGLTPEQGVLGGGIITLLLGVVLMAYVAYVEKTCEFRFGPEQADL